MLTRFDDHFAIYTYIKSCCIAETNIMSYMSIISQLKKLK